MLLRSRILVILSIVFILQCIVGIGVQQFLMFPGFVSLEKQEAHEDLNRVVQALNREIKYLDSLCHDWSAWDDTYRFISNSNPEYVSANLTISTFIDNKINLIYFIDHNGKVIYGKIHDLNNEELIHLKSFNIEQQSLKSALITFKLNGKSLSTLKANGILPTEKGPMILVSRPILTSNNQGPIKGTLIIGKILDKSTIDEIIKHTNVNFKIIARPKHSITTESELTKDEYLSVTSFSFTPIDSKQQLITTDFPDIRQQMSFRIISCLDREITQNGMKFLKPGWITIIISGIALLLITWILVNWMFLNPTLALAKHVLSIKDTKDLTERLQIDRKDEIGTLYQAFNDMFSQLFQTRKKLSEQYYSSGKAEVIRGMLHNIRNTMSPLIGNAEILRARLKNVPLKNVQQARKEIENPSTPNSRQQDLRKYIELVAEDSCSTAIDSCKQLDKIINSIQEVELILDDYQNHAYTKTLVEPVELLDVINESIELIRSDQNQDVKFLIFVDAFIGKPIEIHTILIKQIFSNIFINAIESIHQFNQHKGEIRIFAYERTIHETKMIDIEISDNGGGIDQKMVKRIFERGFSSKKERSSGIGLHWCANTISSMKGRLYAESEGIGKGACFHILLPLIS